MSLALQQLYCSPDSELPHAIVTALKDLRDGDENVQSLSKQVEEERKVLFSDMKVATDESGFQERINAIAEQNKHILDLTSSQQKKAEAAYQQLSDIVFKLDKKRNYFYDKIPEHQTMLKKQKQKLKEAKAASSAEKAAGVGKCKGKSKDKGGVGAGAVLGGDIISAETLHSNEPIYCVCKKVSFGRMIGCDNENCSIEWFHFPCVGLDESLPDPEEWYCSGCSQGQTSTL